MMMFGVRVCICMHVYVCCSPHWIASLKASTFILQTEYSTLVGCFLRLDFIKLMIAVSKICAQLKCMWTKLFAIRTMRKKRVHINSVPSISMYEEKKQQFTIFELRFVFISIICILNTHTNTYAHIDSYTKYACRILGAISHFKWEKKEAEKSTEYWNFHIIRCAVRWRRRMLSVCHLRRFFCSYLKCSG